MVLVISLLIVIGILAAYSAWNYYRLRKQAQFVGNEQFKELMRQGQLIDIRDASSFYSGHIVGARNFPQAQLQQSLSALRKDKPVLIYESGNGRLIPLAVKTLYKAGYHQIYVLESGFSAWDGKTKS
ncbi:rhodanese-like domain-containing protein [Streptococcus saliviloxodontae]|uniref:Rhodanese-related sulfurtransferase n=1 Tax=Streptococcus saliviloxodontae TaxID=1349416 RepID=A0ABS2PJ86_9STRE|nr:rhodanese-like domain-containing protein [Streptococcus saliviloxodontae]MBM7635414.1 rhodanese-related sulfurtransferase [Streptococcus saliviloxodontae]